MYVYHLPLSPQAEELALKVWKSEEGLFEEKVRHGKLGLANSWRFLGNAALWVTGH